MFYQCKHWRRHIHHTNRNEARRHSGTIVRHSPDIRSNHHTHHTRLLSCTDTCRRTLYTRATRRRRHTHRIDQRSCRCSARRRSQDTTYHRHHTHHTHPNATYRRLRRCNHVPHLVQASGSAAALGTAWERA